LTYPYLLCRQLIRNLVFKKNIVNRSKKITLSKSKYIVGLQCLKYMWYLANARDEVQKPDFSTRFMFQQGMIVGEYAKKLFPDGTSPGRLKNTRQQCIRTAELLSERKPIFEASVSTDNLLSRADILKPAPGNTWDIIEVKSATHFKEEYLHDVAFQKYTFLRGDVKINNCYLAIISSQHKKQGRIDPEKLFNIRDISEEADEKMIAISERVKKMLEILQKPVPPDIKIGRHCDNPYTCPLKEKCWKLMPENHVFNLYGNKDRALDLYGKGIYSIEEIPEGYSLSPKQEIQRQCAATKRPSIDRGQISAFLDKLIEPIYFFDFETYSTALPIYDGTKPFQKIPFQYSIHALEDLYGKPVHHDFLASGDGDPRRELLENLRNHLGNSGSIIVYYEFFEKGILNELACDFPEYGDWVQSILPRIVDLFRPFRDFYYYNSAQKGSASVKNVLPAITDYSYKEMDIADGLSASIYFLYACGHYKIGKRSPTLEEVKKIRRDLITYCRMDTGGMIHILRGLKEALSRG